MSTLRELELQQISPVLLEILRRQGYSNLSEFQIEALSLGIMRGKNIILTTRDYDEAYQIAEIALLNKVASDARAKAIVICPNPHQAEKRFSSISQKCRRLGIEAAPIIRRRTATSKLNRGRVVVGTFRSLDIALRSQKGLFSDVQSVIIERLDLLGQPSLGPNLETLLVNLISKDEQIQIISTTPPVADLIDLERWLNAQSVEDRKPEIKRIYSVKVFDSPTESLADLAEFVHYRKGQTLILAPDIQSTERLAVELAGVEESPVALDLRLLPEERDILIRLGKKIATEFSECPLTEKLQDTIKRGVGFLHEGIPKVQRRLVSEAWDNRSLPVMIAPSRFEIAGGMTATTVFLVGVYFVDVDSDLCEKQDLKMLSELQISNVLEAAGRPGLDNEAFGIVVVMNKSEKQRVIDKFFTMDKNGNLDLRLGEADSCMDDTEALQDLVLTQLCGENAGLDNLYAILSSTYWAATKTAAGIVSGDILSERVPGVKSLVSLRATKSIISRAEEIADSNVKLVSANPTKIEGLVHSESREIWHFVTFRLKEGVSCSCESWRFQGVSRHRLCKHLVKFANYALRNEDARRYASSVIQQSMRGLGVLGLLEREGLVVREKGGVICSDLGNHVSMMGVPPMDARKVRKTITEGKGNLRSILSNLIVARTGLDKKLIDRVLKALPASRVEELVDCAKDMPGIIENLLEEIQYVNAILLRLLASEKREGLNKESLELQQSLMALLDK